MISTPFICGILCDRDGNRRRNFFSPVYLGYNEISRGDRVIGILRPLRDKKSANYQISTGTYMASLASACAAGQQPSALTELDGCGCVYWLPKWNVVLHGIS